MKKTLSLCSNGPEDRPKVPPLVPTIGTIGRQLSAQRPGGGAHEEQGAADGHLCLLPVPARPSFPGVALAQSHYQWDPGWRVTGSQLPFFLVGEWPAGTN